MTTVADVLIKARELIADRKKWCKGNFSQPGGKRCAVGALWAATKNQRLLDRAYTKLADAMKVDAISAFNDAPRTTHKQVLAAFDRAISAAQQKQE